MKRKRRSTRWGKATAQAEAFIRQMRQMKRREKLEADQQTLNQKNEVAK